MLVEAGRRLDARALVAAAAGAVDQVEVTRRPRVAIVATGDELCLPGMASVTPYAIPESITPGLAALATRCGAEVVDTRMLADDLETMRASMAGCLPTVDVIVVTGGASVGARDFAKDMFAGLELLFSKVAIKPGKPVWLGRTGGKLVMGLPGNPTSALVTARLLLTPLLIGMAGGDAAASVRWRTAALATPIDAGSDRETFWRAREVGGRVALIANQDSGAQRSLAEADLLVRQPIGAPELAPGDEVLVIDF